nr:carboxypeptidase B-like [Onthophagus taurus]
MKILVLLTLSITAVLSGRVSYDGYKVYQVAPVTEQDGEILKSLKESGQYDFWSNVKFLGQKVSIMVKPELQANFTNILNLNNLDYTVLIENAENVFQQEREKQSRAPKVEKGRINFTQYHRYEAIEAYLARLAEEYADKVIVRPFGVSYEGRIMSYIRIGNNEGNPTILMDAGIHAREWIAPAFALYIIQQLVENPEYAYLSEKVNWVIIPLLNPDGYEYSHDVDRMWRKTRSAGVQCYGVDGNRNFGFMWGGLGTSDNECSEIYRGPYAFSEVEIAAFRDIVYSLENVDFYMALHSFGNWVLYPWGYDFLLTDNNDELHYLGERIADAIAQVFGTYYVVGNSAFLLYPAAGASDDWMKAVGGADLSYTLELPGGGSQGFDLPPERIENVVIETWQGIIAAYEYILEIQKN